ncbi:MAG: IclR family transcriptional regulator [Actinomycetota bacterium]
MRSVRNAMQVVEVLAAEGPMGVGELSRRTGIAKSTVQRCLETLAADEWIQIARDEGPGAVTAWTVGPGLRRLMAGPVPGLAELADPILRRLAAQTSEATHLVTLDGTDVTLRARIEGLAPVQVVLPVGSHVPAYAAATGKAILAAMPPEDLDVHLPDDLRALTDRTITSRRAFFAELESIRSRGWATNRGEWNPTIVAVSAPVRAGSQPIAAISVSTTHDRLPEERVAGVAELVCAAADALGRALVER